MSADAVLIVVGAVVLALGLPSEIVKRLWLSVPLLAMVVGVVLGPELAGVVDLGRSGDERAVLEELARITLAVGLVGTALQINRIDVRKVWRPATLLLTAGMVGMWLVTSLGAHLLLGLPVWSALLLGAILTPTDPVVASSLVSGRLAEANLPRSLRRTLQLEAGANDGLALAFVLVPALVLGTTDGSGAIAARVAEELGIAIAMGVVIGVVAAWLVDLAEDHSTTGGGFFFVSAFALALLTLGAVSAAGGSGVLGAFVAGMAFSLQLEREHAEELELAQNGLEKLVLVPVFVLFGALIPWAQWEALGASGIAFAGWALLLRRPPVVLAALSRSRLERGDRRFLAWFGPVGVAAMFYATEIERFAIDGYEEIYAASTLVIAVSVAVFSLTATPGVRARGGRSVFTTLRHPLTEGIESAP